MDTQEAINARRSIRKYIDKPVEFEKITTILDAANKAPSAGNLQGWRFLLVTDRKLIVEVANYSIEQYWIQSAPILIIVCAVPEKHEMYYGLRGKRLYNIQDCSAAIENILISATDLGLGSCWIGAFEEEKIRSLFNIPSNVRPQAIITIGYSDEIPKDRQLTPIENNIYFNRYGVKVEKLHVLLRDYSVEWQKQKDNLSHSSSRSLKRLKEEWHRLSSRFRKKEKK
ncbi:MAG: nitroreductase family protein [Candidatus Woesearchaeota archaeon]